MSKPANAALLQVFKEMAANICSFGEFVETQTGIIPTKDRGNEI